MNRVIIMGRLAADPELRRTPSDISVTSFTIAVNRQRQKDGTQNTDWIDCVAWRHNAEFISRYFGKGKMILVEGALQTRTYEDKNGNKRKAVEVLVDRAEFCGDAPSKNGGGSGGFDDGFNQAPSSFGAPSGGFEMGSDDDFSEIAGDDDLPF